MKMFFTKTRKTAARLFSKRNVILFFLCLAFSVAESQVEQSRYNVLLISVDDMNNKLSYLGYPAVLTPNIQRLMGHGVAFTNAYCQFSICNPSRISVMSGWRPDKTKVVANNADPAKLVPKNVQYMQDFFHSFGYRTERFGKIYHEQFENEFTWDYFENYKDTTNTDKMADGDIAAEASLSGKGARLNLWGITADQNFVNADSIMATHAATSFDTMGGTPKFVGLGLIETHAPFNPNLAGWNIYGDPTKQVSLPYMGSKKTVLGNSAHNVTLTHPPADDWADIPPIAFYSNTVIPMVDSEWQKAIQAYYAEVSILDNNLGKILDELDKKNLWQNTVVIFVSDHGQHLGEHFGLWYKNTLFNEAQQVPMIICAPGIQPAVCDKMVEEVDIYPTVTELCKLPTPTGMQGVSLVRLMKDPAQQWKTAAFTQTKNKGSAYPLIEKPQAVFTNQYHYNYWGVYGEELYDRINDTNEYTNLVFRPAYAAALDSMRNIRINGWEGALPPPCDSVVYYQDKDGDGYGNPDSSFKGCYQPFDYVVDPGDCNDTNPDVHPGAVEICDGIDNNCNGQVDENGVVATISQQGATNLCKGSSLSLSANTGAGITHQWLKNGLPIAGATKSTLSVTTAGRYSVKETSGACTSISPELAVTIVDKPAASITAQGDLNICAKGSVSLVANNGPGYTYQWKKGSALVSGATGMQYSASSTGTYYVVVTNSNGCSKKSVGITVTSSCLQLQSAQAGDALSVPEQRVLSVYPNPGNGKITATFTSTYAGITELKVYDIAGKLLSVRKVEVVKGSNAVPLDLSSFSNGIYYLETSATQLPQRKQFVISK